MACSVSGQDESNPVLWLATQAGKMELSCPLGTTRHVPQEKFPGKPYNKSFIDQGCSVKMAEYWPHSFFASSWTSTQLISVHKHPKKELGQYPPILTSHLVSSPYLLTNGRRTLVNLYMLHLTGRKEVNFWLHNKLKTWPLLTKHKRTWRPKNWNVK